MQDPFSPKQYEFLANCTATWNLAHGSVRTGKTIVTLYAFMVAVDQCPDSNIWMIGYTSSTIYDNVIKLIFENPILSVFRPFCTWNKQTHVLTYKDKKINTCGAENAGSVGRIQGQTMSLFFGDEMTLFHDSMISMIDTRLSQSWSKGFGAMNPSHPNHIMKQWIDKATEGDKRYFGLHFVLDDNTFLSENYKERIKNSHTGLFYKRNVLGLWVLAEGAVFDFFDEDIHTRERPPRSAEYWIAAIDYGSVNPFSCVLVGVSTGQYTQTGKLLWAEKEYYWDPKVKGKQKTNAEFADDVQEFLEPYGVKSIYIDPSAAAFKVELRRRGMHVVDADNDVLNGIHVMQSEMQQGRLLICKDCKNLIREIQGYVWDDKAAKLGIDAPLKRDDHACVAGDTLVMTDKGEVPIQDLVGMGGFSILNAKDKNIVEDICFLVGKTGENREIYEIELENGVKIRATADHKILTERGYIELQQLTLCDMLFLCSDKNILEESFT